MARMAASRRRMWLGAVLALAIVALAGPWVFDRIHVPAQFECSRPNVRLEGDFCGVPLSGVWVLGMVLQMFAGFVAGPVNGDAETGGRLVELLIGAFILALVIPLFTTLAVFLRPASRRRQKINLVAWIVGLAVAGYFFLGGGFVSLSGLHHLWGLGLYTALALGMIITEARAARLSDQPNLPE